MVTCFDRVAVEACCSVSIAQGKLRVIKLVEHKRNVLKRSENNAVATNAQRTKTSLGNAIQVLCEEH